MYQLLSYLSFYFTSSNQHGVHSPFVYDYITECLYKKTKLKVPVSLKILVKSISYFEYKAIRLVDEKEGVKEKIKTICPNSAFTQNKADIIFSSIALLEFKELDPMYLQNNTLLLVDYIHKNKNNFKHWEELKKLDQVSVTIDLFYCGVVFFRKEQAKEHFKIRI